MRGLERSFREIPYSAALGITVVDCGEAMAEFLLPYSESLVGDPERGIIHGGPITALLDNCCGAAVGLALARPASVATLDLRIDYLRPATRGLDVVGRAECYRVTKSIAFVRGRAFHLGGDDIASASATFMLATRGDAMLPASGR